MKFLPKMEIKFRKLKQLRKSTFFRKLDWQQASVSSKQLASDKPDEIQLSTAYEASALDRPKFWSKSTRETFMYNGSFHEAVGKVLLVAEFVGMMPVKGVTASHPCELSFAWTNVRTLYSLVFIVLSIIDLCLTMYKVLNGAITFANIQPLIFSCCIVLVLLSALSLARKWPTLMMYWHEIECDLPSYHTQADKSRMAYSIRMVMFVGMMLSLAEHLLSIVSGINYSIFCHFTDDPFQNFFLIASEEIFFVFAYSGLLAFVGKIVNIFCTFIWNYMDIFVMIVSIGLASKFRQLNDNLQKFQGMRMPPVFWSERRIQYRNLCMLCEKMDNAIALITMISFSNNLYFICVQLLRSLNHMPSVAHAVYFYYSLSFLIGRTLAVSLYSASVHEESRRPLRYLRHVPKDSWCPEVKRFTEEISTDMVALSGMKFFYLTRKLVLSVAGTIVTYELVLIQFHEPTNLWDCVSNNLA